MMMNPYRSDRTAAILTTLVNAGLMADEPMVCPQPPPRPGDHRRDFALVAWQQGALLFTSLTARWTAEDRQAAHEREQRQAFAHFSVRDEGRSRQFLYEFPTADECRAAVDEHNRRLARSRPFLAGLALHERPPATIEAAEERMITWLIAQP